ncbi:phage tail spike protein [Streptococcus timonensis]|uniref:phage tail spike protein n=1 Tax=Streptococcus timonensis TaxID=1852387 RepID=UPI00094E93BE|nr:phage tail spike protein [Streptococcus timonensis]DAO33834.1 MAG TPA: Neck appendage protein [Caudoviricetes sp.]
MIYLTDGNVPLNAAYADEIVQIDRNTYQLTFKFPTNNVLWQRLREETFLTADDLHGEQDFVIFEVEKQHGYIHVYANQVMTLLNHYIVHPINLDRETGSTALSRFAGSITRDNPFSFFSDIDDRHTFNTDTTNAMEALTKDKHSILGQWGGDLVRHGYQVRLLKNGGSENESLFMYKKNLSSYQHKTSTKSLKTRITFKTTVKGEGKNADDKHYKVVVDSPLINKYSQIYEDVVEVNDQDVKDEASLREYGKQYFRTSLCDLMEDSLEIDVVGQSDVPVQMFDVVGVYHETFDLDVRKKITKYTYSPMAKKLKSIGFGEFKSGLAHAIGNVVSDAVKNETYIFEARLEKEIKNADLDFDRKVQGIKNEITDGLNAAKAKAEEVKQSLTETIDQRFRDFDSVDLNEIKQKSDEALQKAGANADLVEEAKRIATENARDLNTFKTSTQKEREKLSDELKRYSREEAENKLTVIREVIASDYISKRTYVEDAEGTRQRLEAITQDNKSKLAEYKQTVDGQFTNLSSQIASKVDRLDFQQVKETSLIYERILGRTDSNVASNIARMALTSELFEVEVGKRFSNLTNLFYAPTKIPKYISSVATDKHLERVSWGDHDGIRINYTDSMSGWLGVRFPLTKRFVKQGEGLGYRIEIAVDKVPRDGRVLIQLLDNTTSLGMYYNSQIILTKTGNQVFTGYLDIPRTGELNEYSIRFTLTSPGNIVIHKPMVIDKRIIPEKFVDSTDYNNEYNRVTMSLLKDSFAIKALNSAGDIIAGINVGANGNNRIIGKATHITGETLIDNAVIKSAMIDKLKTANFEAGSVTATILGANSVTADKVLMDQAMARKFVSNDIFTDTLAAKTAFINKLRSVVVTATLLEGFKGRIGGFQIGTHDKDPNTYWLTGQNQFAVGMSNGSSAWGQVALWVNWGTDWGKSGPYAWYVLRTGEMYCKNDASFYKKVDFADGGSVNFYGNINYYKEPKFFKGLNMWDSEIIGGGSNPKGGNNAVVWWNQIGSGSVKYWIDKSSDRRLKENITSTSVQALNEINQLNLVSFDYIENKKHEEIGLIAQEVEDIIPQAISKDPESEDSYLHIDYTAFVPYLIKAIQELNQKLEEVNEGRN